jgi:hypothetical protein
VQQNLGTGVLKKGTVPTKWINLCKGDAKRGYIVLKKSECVI